MATGYRLDEDWGTSSSSPAFARDPATAAYYDQRAAEYDEWYLGHGQFADRNRPGWDSEVDQVVDLVAQLPVSRTLDAACGSGYLTRHLRGVVVGADQSPAMVALAQSRSPQGVAIVADALSLPFADKAFDRILTGRVEPEQRQERVLNDGSRHRVYKRYLSGRQLADELGGRVLLDGTWFVAAQVRWAAS